MAADGGRSSRVINGIGGKQLVTTEYTLRNHKHARLKIAHISDLHGAPWADILPRIAGVDLICVTGDAFDGDRFQYGWQYLSGKNPHTRRADSQVNALKFLKAASAIAPTYVSLGNHEGDISDDMRRQVRRTGARLLDNRAEECPRLFGAGVLIAGLSSNPDLSMLDAFCAHKNAYKILLSHHPEHYPRYLVNRDIDLILSGHAHGGQWRIFGRGLYSPGQGILPKLTGGVIDDRLIISRGIGNAVIVPRIFNPSEVVLISIDE